MNFEDELLFIKNQALGSITSATDSLQLSDLKNKYLGKKGLVNQLINKIPKLETSQKPLAGRTANEVKEILNRAFSEAQVKLGDSKNSDNYFEFDITAPGIRPESGSLHLVTQAIEEINNILSGLGFVRERYPQVDWEWYAFEGLNIPANHPARDDFESFFIDAKPLTHFGRMCLTPHTSNGQIREMERISPPIRMTNIGKGYRPNYDTSHTPMFHQFEGLVIDEGISITHLKGTLDYFTRQYFGDRRKTRLRPYHFQFTEPSFEVDIDCGLCSGKGCKFCKEGWLELGGAGMVHPNVLKNGKVDSSKYSGFAFGWGVERVLMMKANLKLPDMRILYQNDLRFLKQF